jgi:hypothetical protein
VRSGVEGDVGGLGNRIYLNREHALSAAKNLLGHSLLARIMKTAQVQHDRFGRTFTERFDGGTHGLDKAS